MNTKSITRNHNSITSRQASSDLDFGDRVREARIEIGWTQPELSKKTRKFSETEIHLNTICSIEKGRSRGSLVTRRVLKETISDAIKRDYPWEAKDGKLDKDSLRDFINSSHLVSEIDQEIATAYKVNLVLPDSYSEIFLERVLHVGIKTTEEIEKHLKEKKQTIKKFAARCCKRSILKQPYLPRGVCIASLQILLLLENGQIKELQKFLTENRLSKNADPKKMTEALKIAHKEATKR